MYVCMNVFNGSIPLNCQSNETKHWEWVGFGLVWDRDDS